MPATLQEVLMGLGSWGLELDWDPSLLADTDPEAGHALLLYWYEIALPPQLILRRSPAESGVVIGGTSAEWYLGLDGDGPVIEEREYVAGTNKLSNPGFDLGDLYYRLAEGTEWEIADGVARVVGAPTKDDVLQADERFEAKAGNQYRLAGRIKKAVADVDRLRLRAVFEGRFARRNLLPDPGFAGAGWVDASDVAGDTEISGGQLVIGPCTRRAIIADGGFESGALAPNWVAGGDPWTVDGASPRTGTKGAHVDAAVTLAGSLQPVITDFVKAGERYRLEGFVRADASSPPDAAFVAVEIWQRRTPEVVAEIIQEPVAFINPEDATAWKAAVLETEIQEGYDRVDVVIFWGAVTGRWHVDDWSLKRTKGNIARSHGQDFAVVPERTHELLAQVVPDAGVTGGRVNAQARFKAAGRPDVVVESPAMEAGENASRLLSWSFTPPSGYTTARVSFVGTDIVGGPFRVDNGSVQITTETESVADIVSPAAAPSGMTLAGSVSAPEGTEQVRLEVVAEQGSGGWEVDDLDFHRVDRPPTAAATIVRDTLVDPDTGERLLAEGEINEAGSILYDRIVRNTTNRELLRAVSRNGMLAEPREWFVDAANALNWGTAEELFTDRDIILTKRDLEVLSIPTAEQNAQRRVTDVKVIGAERESVSGGRRVVTGVASRAPAALTWFGAPLRRKRIIEDSQADHPDFASGLAAAELERDGTPNETVTVSLSDWRALVDSGRGHWRVGDWLQVFEESAGLVDPDNERAHLGVAVWPKKVRVLSRLWRMGHGFRAIIRRADGSLRDITDAVRWEAGTTAELELGNPPVEFVTDPQGGAAGNQFRRFWRSARV